MDKQSFNKKAENLVILTGASSGIGEATWRLLASQGFHVIALARRGNILERTGHEIRQSGGETTWFACDLSDLPATQALSKTLLETYGAPDGIIFNAAACSGKTFEDNSAEDRAAEIGLNYLSPCAMLDVFLPAAKRKGAGKFIAVGSLSALTSFPGNATYAASKSALASLWRSLDLEYECSGMHFSLVLPGLTKTDMTEGLQTFLPRRSPHAVAQLIFETYKKPGFDQTCGVENKVILAITRVFPSTTHKFISRFQTFLIPRKAD